MRVVIFSGTTEGRELSAALASAGADVIVSVASDVGAEEQGEIPGVTVEEGLKHVEQIRNLIRGADLVVDATHPYAVLVTENIRQAAEAEQVERLRLVRGRSELPEELESVGGVAADSREHGFRTLIAEDAVAAAALAREIAGPEGNILLTTGSKELPIYAAICDPEHLVPRVLPVVSSIESCEKAGIPHRNIVAVQGPFSQELNEAVLRDYHIAVMVTKESGRAGGFAEKIRACEAERIPAVVIARPEDDGMDFENVLSACMERIK